MKRMLFCICVVSMVVFPIWALACTPGDPTCSSITDTTVDVKGYGNQYADYTVGNVDVHSYTDSHDWGKSESWEGFSNSVGGLNLPCVGDCGMSLAKGNYSLNNFDSHTQTTVNQKALMGSADMTTQGGLAACITKTGSYAPTVDFSGNLSQTQTVNNGFSGNLPGFGYASGNYTGTQTLNLNVHNH